MAIEFYPNTVQPLEHIQCDFEEQDSLFIHLKCRLKKGEKIIDIAHLRNGVIGILIHLIYK